MLKTFVRIVGVALVFSGLQHCLHPHHFLGKLFSFPFVPGALAVVLAALLPYVQLLLGFALMIGWDRKDLYVITLLLVCTFNLAQLFLAWQNDGSDCGCFGASSNVMSEVLNRNSALIALVMMSVMSVAAWKAIKNTP